MFFLSYRYKLNRCDATLQPPKLILPKSIKRGVQSSLANNCAGIAQSVRLQVHDWGFNVYNIPTEIYFWHSHKDKEVPFEAVEVMINKMKNAKLSISGKGHIPRKKLLKKFSVK